MKKLFIFLCLVSATSIYAQQPIYKNSALPIEQRVEDLIARMTLEEKVAQLTSFFSRDTNAFDENGNFISVQDTAILNRGAGTFNARSLWRMQSSKKRALCMNGIQRYMLEKTRLGIPVLFFNEALHGLMVPGATSFLLVSEEAGEDARTLPSRLSGITGIQALLTDEMIANDSRLFGKLFSAPIRLMVGIAFLVGTLVVGLVIYTATIERRREYGVLKAVGAPNWVLFSVVTLQALVASAAGSLAGVGLAVGAADVIMRLRPQFLIILEPSAMGGAIAAGVAMALLAALLPARILANLPPAEVFRR